MITVNLNKLRVSLEKLKAKRKQVSDTADGRFRQKIYYLAELAVRVSPQFSGEFASNWNLAIDGNMPMFRPMAGGYDRVEARHLENGQIGYRLQPHKAGDPEAVGVALARIAGQLRGVTRHSQVHLVNATELHTDGTRMIGPDGTVNLRPENIIPGRVRIESYVRARAKEAV